LGTKLDQRFEKELISIFTKSTWIITYLTYALFNKKNLIRTDCKSNT